MLTAAFKCQCDLCNGIERGAQGKAVGFAFSRHALRRGALQGLERRAAASQWRTRSVAQVKIE